MNAGEQEFMGQEREAVRSGLCGGGGHAVSRGTKRLFVGVMRSQTLCKVLSVSYLHPCGESATGKSEKARPGNSALPKMAQE